MLVSYAVHCSTSCWQRSGGVAAGDEPQCADRAWYTTDTTRGAQGTRTPMATIVRQPQPIEPIIQQLQNILPQLREEYDVERLGVFGSYVRNEQHAESDIDILVSFRSTPGLLRYISLARAVLPGGESRRTVCRLPLPRYRSESGRAETAQRRPSAQTSGAFAAPPPAAH